MEGWNETEEKDSENGGLSLHTAAFFAVFLPLYTVLLRFTAKQYQCPESRYSSASAHSANLQYGPFFDLRNSAGSAEIHTGGTGDAICRFFRSSFFQFLFILCFSRSVEPLSSPREDTPLIPFSLRSDIFLTHNKTREKR